MAKQTDDDLLKQAKKQWVGAVERDKHNRDAFEDDIKFARLEEQWSPADRKRREETGRPCLTINRLAPVIRQVVNDSRQNKPAIMVMPQDSVADPETAEILSGLIRNIETSSDADIAYDTAVENAVSGGFAYFRINLAYACDDNWDQDIVFERIANPLSVVGDPESTSADGSDWNLAFVSDMMEKDDFEKAYPDADLSEWDSDGSDDSGNWREGEKIRVAEWWTREQVAKKIVLLTDGRVIPLEDFEGQAEQLAASGVTVQGPPRDVMSYKVTQRVITGAQILSTTDWAGKYIPIVPVYGDEVNLNGKRHFRSLIRSAKDAQRMFNYENSVAVELGALAPKVPFIGPKGAFETDAQKWEEVHTTNHPYVQYDGDVAPQRQPAPAVTSQQYQSAMAASDWIKESTGIFDASLGKQDNATSGRAILARQREGDVSTFHFIDNLSRSIRHGGRILIDLIPKVYTKERVIRTLGPEGEARSVPLGQPTPKLDPSGKPEVDERGQAIMRIYDLSAGKYDLTVKSGPSFSTRREEAAAQMIELIRAFPAAAPVMGDLLAKNLDWPGADEIAHRLQKVMGQQDDPQKAQMAQQLQALNAQLQQVQADQSLKTRELNIKAYEAETSRMTAQANAEKPSRV